MIDFELIFNILAALVFGTLLGSFLNVVIWRLPREMGLGGRSHCPSCHKQLRSFELFPLLSYLSSGGKCRQCGKPISARYPAIEAITGLLFVIAWLVVQPHLGDIVSWIIFIKALVIISGMVVVFVVDLEHYLILDKVLLAIAIVVLPLQIVTDAILGHSFANSVVVNGVIGAVGAGGFFFLIWWLSKGKWMGLGDVKLVTLLGFVFGYGQMGVLLLLAFWLGMAVSLTLLASKKATMASKLPFGTFLSVCTVIMLFFGPSILQWYLTLIGAGRV